MPFDSATRNKLQRMVAACRRLLTEEFDDQLQGLYGIYAGEGRILDLSRLAHLDDDGHQVASLLRERIEHLRSGLPEEKNALPEAIRRVLREQAFTLLNRFAALRMAEERGLVQECAAQGLMSKGFQVFETVARSGLGGAYERYRLFILCLFDELSLDLGALFDRFSPFGLLFPRERALLRFFEALNDPELKPLWREDETIGWIYQYFNDEAERKKMREESAAPRNSRELAVRNQFFTPRYVVEFLTDNTLGRIWYEMTRGETRLKEQCRYLVRRPDEVFLAEPHSDEVRAAQAWLQSGGGERPELWHLARTVDGHARAGAAGEESNRWVEEHLPRIKPDTMASLTTQKLLDLLFLFCRKERFCEGTLDSLKAETELILRTIEDRHARGRRTDLSQEELLKQPVFIPFRAMKDPREILMLDPACGSMHFGLYAFDLFEVIYAEAWEMEERGARFARPPQLKPLHETFRSKDEFLQAVPKLIVENNIHGIDIDPRAAQIAGLSLWLRAQKAWQRLGLKPAERPAIKRSNIVCAEPMPGEKELLREFVGREFPAAEQGLFLRLLEAIFDKMQLAGEAGSLLKIEEEIRGAIEEAREASRKLAAKPRELFSAAELNQISTAPELVGLEELASAPAASHGSLTADFWERVEERIYAALRDYAEQAENDGGFQRRLFAEDAARGFAFIDVCRKRYDVALMNPPFGAFVPATKDYASSRFPNSWRDMYSSFIERGALMLGKRGRCGAITSSTFLNLSTLEGFRHFLLGKVEPQVFVNLGPGVMDDAAVSAACSVISNESTKFPPPILFIETRNADDKGAELLSLNIEDSTTVHAVAAATFRLLPQCIFAYWLSERLRSIFARANRLEHSAHCQFGLHCRGNDDQLFRAWWEIEPKVDMNKNWPVVKLGGDPEHFFRDSHYVLDWRKDGAALNEIAQNASGGTLNGAEHYFRPGISYIYTAQTTFSVQPLERNSVFTAAAHGCFPKEEHDLLTYLAFLNSEPVRLLLKVINPNRFFQSNYVRLLPVPSLEEHRASLAEIGARGIRICRSHAQGDECSRLFISEWTCPTRKAAGNAFISAQNTVLETMKALAEAKAAADHAATKTFDMCPADLSLLQSHVGASTARKLPGDQDLLTKNNRALAESHSSYSIGVAYGRWDIRYATGEQAAPELPDPFAPLPVCPPGQLQNARGLPARPEDVPAAYPVRIPWDGILVDDPDHPLDIERRVREVIEIIWGGSRREEAETSPTPIAAGQSLVASAATPEAIEHEACEILGVKSLRDYFRKPAGFFADHLKRYSKSRRQAPIYWPLSTASGSYTLWVYYHRLNDQTLFRCANEFVKPKMEEVGRDAERLQAKLRDSATAKERQQLQDSQDLLAELSDFQAELLRVAGLPYKPNLNDGVLITASPLWKLFRLPKWQKDLKACWEELSNGKYDWAHLAYTIWPDRVKEACIKDRSIAIAHGLEELCEVKASDKRARKSRDQGQSRASGDFLSDLL